MTDHSGVMEKISFVYPYVIREGLNEENLYPPEIAVWGINKKELQDLVIVIGFLSGGGNDYAVGIDILFNGKTVIMSEQEGKALSHSFSNATPGQFSSISKYFVEGADLSRSGIYTVEAEVFKTKNSPPEKYSSIDKMECYFVVSSERDSQ